MSQAPLWRLRRPLQRPPPNPIKHMLRTKAGALCSTPSEASPGAEGGAERGCAFQRPPPPTPRPPAGPGSGGRPRCPHPPPQAQPCSLDSQQVGQQRYREPRSHTSCPRPKATTCDEKPETEAPERPMGQAASRQGERPGRGEGAGVAGVRGESARSTDLGSWPRPQVGTGRDRAGPATQQRQ